MADDAEYIGGGRRVAVEAMALAELVDEADRHLEDLEGECAVALASAIEEARRALDGAGDDEGGAGGR